jgi:FlaG/FlaF family flagellin (archaellin)
MQRGTDMKEKDDAVSPVIGVMLMLVVTIIIAAVISGFAGGLVTSQEAAPSASFDVSLTAKSIDLTVRSLSEPIRSKDIVIVLSNAGGTRKLVPGSHHTVPFGFNIMEQVREDAAGGGFKDGHNVSSLTDSTTQAAHESNTVQWFGNYTLQTGSRMSASGDAFIDVAGIPLPGFTQTSFSKSEICGWTADQWTSVFGTTASTTNLGSDDWILKLDAGMEITNTDLATLLDSFTTTDGEGKVRLTDPIWAEATDHNWHFGGTSVYGDGYGGISVSPGDRVTVTIVHTPSGQTMFMKTVTVKEA